MAIDMGTAQGQMILDTSGIEQSIQRVVNTLNVLSSQVLTTNNTLATMSQNLASLAGTTSQPTEQLTGLSKTLEDVRSGLATFNDSTKSTAERLKGLATAATTVGQGWTEHISKPMFEVGKTMVEMATTFESQMDRVGSIAGATGAEFEQLTAYAQEMGAKTMFSSQQCGEAMEYMAMAGWNVNQIMDGLPGVLNLAAIGQTELARASDIVTDALTAFGEEANQAGRLADIMAATITRANTDVEMLGQTFKYVAPVAGAAGYSMEETATMIGLMGNAGIKASQAGTSLRATISRLTTQSGEAGEAMEDLGIVVTKEDGNLITLTDTMNMLREKIHGLTEEEQVAYSKKLAGMTAFSGLLGILNATDEAYVSLTAANQAATYVSDENRETVEALATAMAMNMTNTNGMEDSLNSLGIELRNSEQEFGNLVEFTTRLKGQWGDLTTEQQRYFAEALVGKDSLEQFNEVMSMSNSEFDTFIKSLGEAGGLANIVADQMMDNLKGKLLLLQSATENAAIAFGTLMIPVIEKVVGALQNFVNWVNSLSEEQKKLVLAVGAAVAAFGPLLLIFGKTLSFGLELYANLGRLKEIFSQLKTVIGSLPGPITLFNNAIQGIKKVGSTAVNTVKDLALAFTNLSLPIKLVVAAIGLLVAAYTTNFGNLRTIVKEFVAEHGWVFQELLSLFSNIVGAIAKLIGELIKSYQEWKEANQETFEAISSFFEALFRVASTILGALLDVFGAFIKGINAVFDFFKGKDKEMQTTGKDIGNAFSDGLDEGMNKVNENADKQGVKISESFGKFKDHFFSTGQETGTTIAEGILDGTETGLSELGITASDAIKGAEEPTKQAATELTNAVEEGIHIGMLDLSNILVTETADAMIDAFDKAGVHARVSGQEMMNTATGEIIAVWNEKMGGWAMTDAGIIASGIDTQIPRVASSIDELRNAIGSKAPDMEEAGKNLILSATGEIVATWNDELGKWQIAAPEKIVNGIYATEETSRQAAESLAQATADGFIDQWEIAADFIANGGETPILDGLSNLRTKAAEEAAAVGSEAGKSLYDTWVAEVESKEYGAGVIMAFKRMGIELKQVGNQVMNETTGEIFAVWNENVQRWEITDAGKLAIALKAQEKGMMQAAIDNIKAANNGIVTQWDILVAAAKGELFPELPQTLDEQSPASNQAGQNNITSFSEGAKGIWSTVTYPWFSSLGPIIKTALDKGAGPAKSSGSGIMSSFYAGIQAGWAQVAAFINQKIAWIAQTLASALSFGGGGSGGSSGRNARSAAYSLQEPVMLALEEAGTEMAAYGTRAAAKARDAVQLFANTARASSSSVEKSTPKITTIFSSFFTGLVEVFDRIEKLITDFYKKSEEEQQKAIDKFVKPSQNMFDTLVEIYTNGFRKLQEVLEKGFDFKLIDDSTESINITMKDIVLKMSHVYGEMDGILQNTLGAIDETWNKGWAWLLESAQKTIEEIDKAWVDGMKKLEKDTSEGLDSIKKTTGMSLDELKGLAYLYGDNIGSMWASLGTNVKTLTDAVTSEKLVEHIKNVGDKVNQMGGAWTTANAQIEKFIQNSGEDMPEAMNAVADAIDKPTELFEELGKSWKEIGEASDTLAKGLDNLADRLFAVELTMGEIMRQFKLFDDGTEISADSVKELNKAFKRQFDLIKDAVDELINTFGESETKIGDASTKLFMKVYDAFKKTWWDMLAWWRKPTPDQNLQQFVKDTESWFDRIRKLGERFMWQFGHGMKTEWTNNIKPMFETWLQYMVDTLDRMRQKLYDMRRAKEEADRLAEAMRVAAEEAANTQQTVVDGSHANGLAYVPFNGYIAELHAGERVLTKDEAKEYRNDEHKSSGDTFIFNSPQTIDVREATRLLKRAKRDLLGGFA